MDWGGGLPQRVDVIIGSEASSAGKAAAVVAAFPELWRGTVLDVGCRDRVLARLLPDGVAYVGLDLVPPAEIVTDLDSGIPLSDRETDVVVALDVLEHTNDIHGSFRELLRVARRHVVVSLPNLYDVKVRLSHVRGREFSHKYGLPVVPPQDRHRWFFSFRDAQRFCRIMAEESGWRAVKEFGLVGRRRGRFAPLVTRYPNLFAPTYGCALAPIRGPD